MHKDDNYIFGNKSQRSILVLGSYSNINALEDLQNRLRDDGFEQTYLVKDKSNLHFHPTSPTFAYDKSVYYIHRSDLNHFVFFEESNNNSAIVELLEIFNNGNPKKSVIFIESECDFGTLLNQAIIKHDIKKTDFNNVEELISLAKAYTRNFFADMN